MHARACNKHNPKLTAVNTSIIQWRGETITIIDFQDFSETYERVHEESLNTMTREELLQEHMDLENKFNQLQVED